MVLVLLGVAVGTVLGVVGVCLVVSGSRADRESDRLRGRASVVDLGARRATAGRVPPTDAGVSPNHMAQARVSPVDWDPSYAEYTPILFEQHIRR